ncbi:beta (1-6) glucans synthase [Pseudomonas sp. CAU 1711]|uniref:glycoside hydrolase family 17 protein n=1 Tax=Pseudomonas sp. CAU 1711 TaxID=3140356 RepID=UPI003260A699
MTHSPRASLAAYCLALLAALAALAAAWYWVGRPLPLADAATPTHKLQCASYTPFAKDQSPFQQPFVLRPERVEADLALLAQRFRCIRTYSQSGLEALPELARKHGLKMLAGAWIGADTANNEREVAALIAAAKAYPDVIEAAIVGNEVLLRKEATAAQLVALIERVKAEIEQPVTYADVWEFWIKHPEMAPAVDFLTLHLLPYWEDEPSGIDAALAQVANVRRAFASAYAPKDILIGETGWPSEGRQRETALPSRVNQALFIRGFVRLAEDNGWRYNLIEAFDQPWKRDSEGAVGGYWGLFDAARQDKGILAGPVSNLPHWPLWLGASGLLLLAALVLAGRPASTRAALLLPPSAALGAACILGWSELALITSRGWGEWLWATALLGLNLLVLAHAVLALGARPGWRGRAFAWLDRRGGWWLAAAGFAAAVLMLALVFDARYRSFPSLALLLPALVYLCRPVCGPRREIALLAALIGAGIAPQLYQEGPHNLQAIGWALTCTLLVAALWRSLRTPPAPQSA